MQKKNKKKNTCLTKGELLEICKKNKYVLLIYNNAHKEAINCDIALLNIDKKKFSIKDKTFVKEYNTCCINTYISNKMKIMYPLDYTL
jgi:uncharacterized protein YbgA (DUF1722 family)